MAIGGGCVKRGVTRGNGARAADATPDGVAGARNPILC